EDRPPDAGEPAAATRVHAGEGTDRARLLAGGPGAADRLRYRRGRDPRDAGRMGDDHHAAARRLAAVHRARLRDRLLVGPERGAGAREPDLFAAVVCVGAVRAAQPAPGVHPEPGALPAELPLRAARVERARGRA